MPPQSTVAQDRQHTLAEPVRGSLMMEAREFSQTDGVVLGLLVYALLGLISDLALRVAERRMLTWRRGLRAT
ncbi:hypothetical protein [Micromonospora orduensis]|uniref:hypothetical protein n=1 Tax=Micromonospora orduensis TaxID=1420891 RepID=UPI001FCB28D2|nr:hypothetical protein [Micromonospora orduensis]